MIQKEKLSGELLAQLFGANSKPFKNILVILDEVFTKFNVDSGEDFKSWKRKFSKIYKEADCNKNLFLSHTYLTILINIILAKATFKEGRHSISDLNIIQELPILTESYFSTSEYSMGKWVANCLKNSNSEVESLRNKFILNFREISKQIWNFETSKEDLFNRIYQDIISASLRHSMGEFYTPPFLAEKMISESYMIGEKVLDPACGSGTFLIELIKYILKSNEPIERKIAAINNIHGYDLNPFAVYVSQVNIFMLIKDYFSKCNVNVERRDSIFPEDNENEKNFDVIIGNPPWLTYSSLESLDYQNNLKELVKKLGIKPSPKNILNLDLSAVFFYQCSSLYLKNGGKIFFVITSATITGSHNDRFRNFRGFKDIKIWDFNKEIFNVDFICLYAIKEHLQKPKNLEELKDMEFPVEYYIINSSGSKKILSKSHNYALVPYAVVKKGENVYVKKLIPKDIKSKMSPYAISYYYDLFHKGADLNPRNLIFVKTKKEKGDLVTINPDHRIFKKAKEPWKKTEFKDQVVEDKYIFKCVKSTEIVKYNVYDSYDVFLPLNKGDLSWEPNALSQHASSFYSLVNNVYLKTKKSTTKHNSLMDNLNRWGKLINKRQLSNIKVVYNNSGSNVSAAVIVGDLLVTGDLSFYDTEDINEAYYLIAILNSPKISEQIKIRKSSRHIFKKVLEFSIKKYDNTNQIHLKLSEIGAIATKKSKDECDRLLSESNYNITRNKIQSHILKHLLPLLEESDKIVKKLIY